MLNRRRFARFFVVHAISKEVRDGREYTEFENAETTSSFYPVDDLAENQRRGLSRKINWMLGGSAKNPNPDPGGIIIHRVPPPGLPPITPELRPWKPRPTRKRVRYHGEPTDEPLLNPETKLPLGQSQILTPQQARANIKGKWHKGKNSQIVHIEQEVAKYDFLETPRRPASFPDLHGPRERRDGKITDRSANPDKFLRHIVRWHLKKERVPGTQEWREHLRLPGLYEWHHHPYSVKVQNAGLAERLDIHVLALPLFLTAERVVLGLEGCIKADAMLTRILATGEQSAVCSYASVTLPNYDELEQLAPIYLGGKIVFLVCDADWETNPLVEDQMLFLRTFLRECCGIEHVHIAAPPIKEDAKRDKHGKLKQNGVDDFYAKFPDATIDDLEVHEREAPPIEFYEQWLLARDWRVRRGRWREGIRRDAFWLRALALHAHIGNPIELDDKARTIIEGGDTKASLRKIARVFGVHSADVSFAVKQLLKYEGVIAIDKPLKTQQGRYVSANYFDWKLDWLQRPTISIVQPQLRATRLPRRTVGEITTAIGKDSRSFRAA